MWMRGGRGGKERAVGREGEKGGMYMAPSMITSNWTLSCVCAEYFQPANRFCFSCAPTCEGCTGPSSTDCLQCATGFAQEFNSDRSSWVITMCGSDIYYYNTLAAVFNLVLCLLCPSPFMASPPSQVHLSWWLWPRRLHIRGGCVWGLSSSVWTVYGTWVQQLYLLPRPKVMSCTWFIEYSAMYVKLWMKKWMGCTIH